MTVVAITGGPGAPGATSAALALLLSWPLADRRRVLLLEADPDGGAVLAGALQGEVQANRGLRRLALSDRRGRLLEEMWDQCIDISPTGSGDRLLLPGLTDPAQATALHYTWEPLADACQRLDGYGCDVIVDLGRSGGQGGSAVLARRADAVLAVVRTTLRGLSTARPRVAALSAELAAAGAADALALLLVREGPYAAAEVSRTLGVPVVGLFPFAPKDARVLSDGGGRTTDRRFQRSELMRSARSAGDEVRALTARRRLVPRPAAASAAARHLGEQPRPATAQPSAVATAGTAPSASPVPQTYGEAASEAKATGAAPRPFGGPAPQVAPEHGAVPPRPYHDRVQDAQPHRYGAPPAPQSPAPSPEPIPLRAVPAPGPAAPTAPPAGPLTPAADATRLGYRQAQAPPTEPSPTPRPWPAVAPADAPRSAPTAEPSRDDTRPWPHGVSAPAAAAAPGAPVGGSWPQEVQAPAATAHAAPLGGAPSNVPAGSPWPHAGSAPAAASRPTGAGAEAAGGAVRGTGGTQPLVPDRVLRSGEAPGQHYPRSLREVLELAAGAELGAEAMAPRGPVASPLGPVTPGQAARLQAVHLDPVAPPVVRDENAGNLFNPPHLVAMPPLAEHAPRPPAPEEFRPADAPPAERHGGDGPTGEAAARVR